MRKLKRILLPNELEILKDEQEILSFSQGNATSGSKGGMQSLPRGVEVRFTAYF